METLYDNEFFVRSALTGFANGTVAPLINLLTDMKNQLDSLCQGTGKVPPQGTTDEEERLLPPHQRAGDLLYTLGAVQEDLEKATKKYPDSQDIRNALSTFSLIEKRILVLPPSPPDALRELAEMTQTFLEEEGTYVPEESSDEDFERYSDARDALQAFVTTLFAHFSSPQQKQEEQVAR
jgi:hypothetical protein